MVQVAAYDSRYGVFALRYWEKCVKLYFLLILLCCSIQPHHLLKSCWQIESMRRGGIDLEDGTKTGGGVLIILAGETGRRDYLTFGDIIKRAVSWIIERKRGRMYYSVRHWGECYSVALSGLSLHLFVQHHIVREIWK